MARDDPGARDAMEAAEDLPQLDATELVETAELEAQVKEMYRQVADEEDADFISRPVAFSPRGSDTRVTSWTGSRRRRSTPSRASATTSIWPRSARARACWTSGADPARTCSSPHGRSANRGRRRRGLHARAGSKGTRLRDAAGIGWAEFAEGPIDDLPFEEASFDVVISNGVINLSPVKARVFSEAARVCVRADGWRSPTSSVPSP